MITKIEIENFYSIAEKQTIDFTIAKNAPDCPEFIDLFDDGKVRVPSVIAFYGANASGKTTVLRALISVFSFVQFSSTNEGPDLSNLFQPYYNNQWMDKPTRIAIELSASFIPNETLSDGSLFTLFRYECQISNSTENILHKTVLSEQLSYKAKSGNWRKLFEREGQDIKFYKDFEIANNDIRIQVIDEKNAIIGRLSKFNHNLSANFLLQINELHSNVAGHISLAADRRTALSYYNIIPEALERLNQEIKRFDLGIEAVQILKTQNGLLALFKHVNLDMPLTINNESQGTQKFFDNFPAIDSVLLSGGMSFIDELDTEVHPILLPEIISWFYNKNRNQNKAQLIITAHNTSLLDELQKEQVFFTEKPYGKGTQVYGAKEIQGLRREPMLSKKYLSGALGAIPNVG